MSALSGSHRISAGIAGMVLSLLAGCTGGSAPGPEGTGDGAAPCAGFCQDSAAAALSAAAVEDIIQRATAEARTRNAPATIAVVDRVGNVLAVYRMTGSRNFVTVRSPAGIDVGGGLEGVDIVPSEAAAIAKAVTAAYLSSEGNAFSTRSASQIVQEAFNPGEANQTGGPLFGVQFSQLPCSDLMARFGGAEVGPHRSPLGLSADPGGLPLYIAGTPVGGVGVIADGLYSYDANITNVDRDVDGQRASLPVLDGVGDQLGHRAVRAARRGQSDVPGGPPGGAGGVAGIARAQPAGRNLRLPHLGRQPRHDRRLRQPQPAAHRRRRDDGQVLGPQELTVPSGRKDRAACHRQAARIR